MERLVSIIIPVYNVENYLGECLNSVINQTYSNLEIILINDGSTDKSGKICDEYALLDKRIKVIHKKNEGVSSARNMGIDLAKGEYIAFVDSDDLINEKYISSMYQNCIETNSDLTFCRFSKYEDGRVIKVQEKMPECLEVNINEVNFVNFICQFFNFKKNIFGSCCRTLYKKDIIKSNRFNPNIKISEDLLFLLQTMLTSKRISSVNEHLYFYRQSRKSTTSLYKKKYLNSQLTLHKELQKFFNLFYDKKIKRLFEAYSCLLCYYVLSNEIKFKSKNTKTNIKAVCESDLYIFFCLKNGLKISGLKRKIKFLIVWFLVKLKVI